MRSPCSRRSSACSRSAENGPQNDEGPGEPGPGASSCRELELVELGVRLDVVVAVVARRGVGVLAPLLVSLDVVLGRGLVALEAFDLLALFRHLTLLLRRLPAG